MSDVQAHHPPLYRPHLQGKELLKAAFETGSHQGESIYAQSLYCRDLVRENSFFDFGYTSIFALTAALWDWSKRKTREMVAIAETIHNFPRLCRAFRKGRLDWTKARLLLRYLDTIEEPNERQKQDERWVKEIHKTYRELEVLLAHDALGRSAEVLPLEYRASVKWEGADLDKGLPGGKVKVSFELPPDSYVIWEKAVNEVKKEQMVAAQEREPGEEQAGDPTVSFHEVIAALARKLMGQKNPGTKLVAPAEVVVQTCPHCERTTIHSTELGEIPLAKAQEKALRDSRPIPQGLYKKVLQRERYQCAVPGCRNHLWLHLHHIKPWVEGGGHSEDNLVTLCSTHHRLLHEGKLKCSHEHGDNGNSGAGLCFTDRFGRALSKIPIRAGNDSEPKPLNINKIISRPTRRDRRIAQAIKADMWEDWDADQVQSPDPTECSHEHTAAAYKRRIRQAIRDFYDDQAHARKKLVPRFEHYEMLLQAGLG